MQPIEVESHVAELIWRITSAWTAAATPPVSEESNSHGARIIAVLKPRVDDAWLPYRQAMSPEEAVAELLRCTGSPFDPKVVEAFVQTSDAQEHTRAIQAPEAA